MATARKKPLCPRRLALSAPRSERDMTANYFRDLTAKGNRPGTERPAPRREPRRG